MLLARVSRVSAVLGFTISLASNAAWRRFLQLLKSIWLSREFLQSVCPGWAQPHRWKEACMANFGDYHLVSGAGWSVYWRISQLHGSGLEIWFADFQGRRVMWRGSQPFAIVPYHRPIA